MSYSEPAAFLIDTRTRDGAARPGLQRHRAAFAGRHAAWPAGSTAGRSSPTSAGRVLFTLPGIECRVVEPRLADERAADRGAEAHAALGRARRPVREGPRARSTACRSGSRPTAAGSCCSAGRRSGWPARTTSRASRRLLPDRGRRGVLSFTPDSRFVSTESRGSPVLLPLAGGRARPGLDYGSGVWSRDGRLAYLGYAEVFAPHHQRPGATLPGLRHRHARPQPARRRALPVRRSQLQRAALAARRAPRAPAHGHELRRQRPLRRAGGRRRRRDRLDARPAQPRDPVLVAGRQAHRRQRPGVQLPPRRRSADPHRDRGRRRLGSAARDRRRRSQRGQLRPLPVVQPGRTAASRSRTALRPAVAPDRRGGGGGERTQLLPRASGVAAAGVVAGRPRIAYAEGRAIKAVAPAGGTPELLAKGLPPRLVRLGRARVVAGRHARSPSGAGRGIYVVTVGQARERAARDPRALRRQPVVLARRRADRVRRAPAHVRSASRARSWSRASTAATSARSARCRSGEPASHLAAVAVGGGVAAGSGKPAATRALHPSS